MTVHVAMQSLSGLLGDVVADAFADDPEVHVRALAANSDLRAVLWEPTDVLIVGVDDPDRIGLWGDALARRPGLMLIGVSRDAQHGWIYELRPRPRALAELSSAALHDAVAASMQRAGRQGLEAASGAHREPSPF